MIKSFITLSMILALNSFSSCDKPPFGENFYSLVIQNKSNLTVSVNFYDLETDFKYPDTTLPLAKPKLTEIIENKGYEFTSMNNWNERFKSLKADTLSIYFINSNTLQNQSWDTIRTNYMILQRYDLSLKDLQNRNFEIEYPYDSTRGKIKVYKR
jgi:hypothetical protein